MIVFVRFVPGGEIIGRARIIDPDPIHHESGPEPDLHWWWHPVEYLNARPIRGVFVRDFGVSAWRARRGLIGLTTPEREALAAALDAASATGA